MKSIEENKSLSEMTSWKVGGAAQFFVAPRSKEELKEAALWALNQNIPITVLGHGSNVLISDAGVSGLVIQMRAMNQILRTGVAGEHFEVCCEAGTAKSEVLKLFLKEKLPPAVFLAGLPGDMGGGVVMNAGVGTSTVPKEFCEIVKSVEVLSFEQDNVVFRNFDARDLRWSYRQSQGWQPGILSQVTVSWPYQPDDETLVKVRKGNQRRKATQPLHLPSCGSVFKNPEGGHSGALIEEAGLKGFSIGGAQVSEKHGNFIVNTGGATALEIHQVMEHVQAVVREKFNVSLTNEVAYLGSWTFRN